VALFIINDELQMLRNESISLIVSKNSGGTATYSKIEAARALQIPIVMPLKLAYVAPALPAITTICSGRRLRTVSKNPPSVSRWKELEDSR
jgi:hypothetical protein